MLISVKLNDSFELNFGPVKDGTIQLTLACKTAQQIPRSERLAQVNVNAADLSRAVLKMAQEAISNLPEPPLKIIE